MQYDEENTRALFYCDWSFRLYKIDRNFEGNDKIICKSLLPYINTGSHTINDDFHLSVDKDMVDKYKDIFRKIFENTHQIDHYNMMMGL